MAGKPKYGPEDRKRWEQAALAGFSTRQVALNCGVPWGAVADHLKAVGLFERNYKANRKLTPEMITEMIALYKAGKGSTTLAAKFGVDKKRVLDMLNEFGDGTRPRSDRVHGKREVRSKFKRAKRGVWGRASAGNHDAFSKLDREAFYWLGFIVADGSIGLTGVKYGAAPTVGLTLSASDADHIHKFLIYLGLDRKPNIHTGEGYAGNTGIASSSYGSRAVVGRIRALGILENKGKDQVNVVAQILAESPDFWRGVWDGDGSLASVTGPYLAGSLPHLNQWRAFAIYHGLVFKEPRWCKTTYRCEMPGFDQAPALCALLKWEDADQPALLRKRVSAHRLQGRSVTFPIIVNEGICHTFTHEGITISGIVYKDLLVVRVNPILHNEEALDQRLGKRRAHGFWVRARARCYEHGCLRLMLIMPGDRDRAWQSLIASRTGKLPKGKGARSYEMIRCAGPVAGEFYEQQHIQGAVGGRSYALVEGLSPRAVLTMAKPGAARAIGPGGMLTRFAVQGHIPGAASRLLAAALLDRPQDILTFSDHRYTDGWVYRTLGFEAVREVAPDHRYWRDGKALHKSSLQKARIAAMGEDIAEATETELTRRLGYVRLYDMGKTRWELKMKKPGP